MKKIILSVLITMIGMTVLFITVTGYFIGNYMVQFGLERGSETDPKAPPRAFALLMPPENRRFNKPDEVSEIWQEKSADGLLLTATHFFPDWHSDRWVIVVHGYGCTQQNSWYIASTYLAQGYHVLTPDLRASGDSEGRFLTMGYRESEDVVHWAKEIVKHYADARIILHGVSMGAAAVMMASADDDLPANVVACIEDCGFTDAYQLLALQMEKSFGLPAFPSMNLIDYRCEKLAGFSLKQAAPLEAVKHAKIPMLFIHGEKDTLVPPYMADLLFNAAQAPRKDIFIVPKAIHGVASQTAHEAYYRRVFDFVEPYVKE
ncbi:MAG: alpha/beta hydrolase [Selenomonadaceae bacterium]|nr:alpha/beta hydrolase [Selenomonadaceae bacterium]